MPLTTPEQIQKAQQAKKIAELSQSIRKKHAALKTGKFEDAETLQKLFKPVTTSLANIKVKTEESKPNLVQPIIPKTIKAQPDASEGEKSQNALRSPISILMKMQKSIDDIDKSIDKAYGDYDYEDDYNDDSLYPKLAIQYVTDFMNQSYKIDRFYGPQYDNTKSKWWLGKKCIDFEKETGDIIINKTNRFAGTDGLYQLIFYDNPKHSIDDLESYKAILNRTGAHLNSAGKLKYSSTNKYINIIRPLMRKDEPAATSTPAKGSGMRLKYNTKPVEYIFWDDPNELVDRLRLLLASKDAGNTSHDNEIISIINELKEANIIR